MIFDISRYKLPKTTNFIEAQKRFDKIVVLEYGETASSVKDRLSRKFGKPFVIYVAAEPNTRWPKTKAVKNFSATWYLHGKFFLTNSDEIILELMMLENDFKA